MASELENVVGEMRAEIANGDGERVQAYMVEQWADRLAALDGGWRPIEEAPKHKRVLVRDAEGDMDVAWWSEQDKCWVVRLLLNEDPIVCTPTHYLPNESLPAPPEGAKP